jgi:hypothetical protein
MKNKTLMGLSVGIAAGIIDVTPMIIQKLPIDADISAFTMWIVIGTLLPSIDIKVHPILKGIIVSFAMMSPCGVLIGFAEPFTLIPVSIMTTILGGLVGFAVNKYIDKR